ncbi:MAG: ABC transporter permease [Halolamina sp.]
MSLWAYLAPFERFIQRRGNRIGQVAIWVLLFYLWAPIAVLVIMSFSGVGVLTFPPTELTLDWYRVFLENEAAHRSMVNSVKVAVPTTIVTTLLGLLIAFAVDRYEFPGKEYLQIIATLPIVVPLVVTGVALILYFGLTGIPTGTGTVVIAHVIRTLPFATLIITATFLSFDRTLEEASKDLGADELRTFRKVTLPNILPGVIAGALLVFTVSFNEFVYTFFVRTTGESTLPIYIWGRIRYQVTPEVNVMSVVFLVIAIGFILIAVAVTTVQRLTFQE